jgi:hypothetical protein
MPRPKKSDPKYIRNVRYVPVSIRLDTGRRLELRPRGQRGDTLPVNEEEMQDEKFLGNMDLLFEVITPTEAKNVIAKQTTNQQVVHPALAHLKNERGEQYERGVVIEENFTDQGQRVAVVDERGQIERFRAPGSTEAPLPEIPSDVPPEEAVDWVARQKNIDGPEAGLGNLKVTKSEVQKES